jgi:tetratricopeptide (TPR) repeat protein
VYEQARRDPTGEKTSVDLMDDALSRKTAGLAVGRDLSPAQSSRFWFNEGMKCVKRRGIGQAAFMAKKVFYMFNAYAAHDTFPVLVKEEKLWWLACLGIGTLAPFAALGMVVTLREWRRLALGYALVLTPVVSMMIFYVAPRFRLDLEAMLIPFGAAGGVWLFDRLRARDAKRALAACAGVAVLMMGNHFSDSDILKEKRVAEIQRHQFLGDIARDEGRVYDAVNKYRAAIALARYPSEAAECLRALAGVYRASGDSESARRCEQLARGALPPEMLQALSAHADNADARNTLGRHYLLSKEYGKAVEEFSQAVALDRYNPVLRLNLAEAMFQAKSANPDDAASEINASLEYGLRFSSLAYRGYTLLGRCFMAKGDWASARRSLEEALRLAPRYGPAHALLAEVYLKMGDKKLAEEHAAAAHSPGQ